MGEAAALPNFNRAVANWCGPHERGLGISITISGIGVGLALTPPLTAWIMVNYGWQTAFYVAGAIGVVIALIWFWFATDRPEEHPRVNALEATLIRGDASPKKNRRQANARSLEGICPNAQRVVARVELHLFRIRRLRVHVVVLSVFSR